MVEIISVFSRILCLFYFSNNVLNIFTKRKRSLFTTILSLLLLFFISIFSYFSLTSFSSLISFILFALFIILFWETKYDFALILSSISHVFYYIIHHILASLILITLYILKLEKTSYVFISILICLLCFLVLKTIIHTKKIEKFFRLFSSKNFIQNGLLLSFLLLILKTYTDFYSNNLFSQTLIRFATILLAFLLFAWWRKQITKSYIEKLRKLEIQSLYDELEEKERLIKKLTADNESLSRIIHKDNKLIPAMEHAVTDFLSCNHMQNPESLKQYGKELSDRLQEMTRDRKGILTSYDDESRTLRLTNHFGIDAALVYMQKKAEANHVFLECKHSPEVVNYILTKISESDLADLLSDLIENAIISLNGRENGRITVTFGQFNKEGYISVADNGIPFDITTLHSLGLMQHTTHKDEGGSGIGLMAIWELKKKYRATIQIQEYGEKPEGFSKRILFSFNNKNHYVIQSYRHTDILNTQTRGDLYVIPADTKETNGGKTA